MKLTKVLEHAPAFVREFEWDVDTIRDLAYHGAESGAFMPAVTYCDAKEFMALWGEEVIDYIDDCLDEVPSEDNLAWSRINVYYMSMAFELWAVSVISQLED